MARSLLIGALLLTSCGGDGRGGTPDAASVGDAAVDDAAVDAPVVDGLVVEGPAADAEPDAPAADAEPDAPAAADATDGLTAADAALTDDALAGCDGPCPAVCGNGVLEPGEACDVAIPSGAGACPTSCSDGDACTLDLLVGAGSCAAACKHVAPDCAPPLPGRLTLCGRLYDAETSAPVDDGIPGNGEPARETQVRAYDALAFAADPATAPPLATSHPDGCGWWEAASVSRPAHGFVAVVVDDCPGGPSCVTPAQDRYAVTAVAPAVELNQVGWNVTTFVVRHGTDAAWTSSAGAPFGSTTFGQRGAYLPIFVDRTAAPLRPFVGRPAPGVIVTVDGSAMPGKDHYFGDAVPASRTTVDAGLSLTGAPGAALLVDIPLTTVSGSGGAPTGCTWQSAPGVAIPGAVLLQPHGSECCSTDPECGAGRVCRSGACLAACASDLDCAPADERCRGGACSPACSYTP